MSINDNVKKQGAGFGLGAAAGAITGSAATGKLPARSPKTAIQVGQAVGSSLRNGAGVSGAAAAGAAVVTAKAAAVGAVAVAAAPVVAGAAVVGAAGYAAYKLLKDD